MIEMVQYTKQAALLCAVLSLGLNSTAVASTQFSLTDLQVNHMTAPKGLDEQIPRFSWQMKRSEKNQKPAVQRQIAYEIHVKDEDGRIVWDSGKVEAGGSVDIAYSGSALKPEKPYIWTVQVWDQDGDVKEAQSVFETGLNVLRQGEGNWQGAKWIGGDDDLPLNSQSLAVYRIKTKIQLAKGSSRAGFLFGANDSRLMEKGKNLWGESAGKDKSWIKVVLDVSALQKYPLAQAKLQLYRQGYSAKDNADYPLAEFTVPRKSINAHNLYQTHSIQVTSNHGILRFIVDDEEIPLPKVNFWTNGYVINPAGPGGDYISYPMVADIGFSMDAGQKANFSELEICNYRRPENAVFRENLSGIADKSIFSGKLGVSVSPTGYFVDGGSKGTMVLSNPSHGAMPMLRTVFLNKGKTVKRARLYATSRGIYDVYINGSRVSDDYFAPGFTQYDKTQLYQVYDVTNFLKNGANAIGAQLAEGWWSGAITFQGENWNYFGDRQSLLAKLVITYMDGSQQVLTTQPDVWKYYKDGPVRNGSLFQGESYDALHEAAVKGWSLADYSGTGWQAAREIPVNESTAYIGTWKHCMTGMEKRQDYQNVTLVGQEGSSVKSIQRLKAKSVHKIADKVYIYDMGQNMAGVPCIHVSAGQAGKVVTLRYAEMLYPYDKLDKKHGGELMLENIRGALATDTYRLKGGSEVISPRYTYHGYRYIEISGLPELPLDSVQGDVLSSVSKETGMYQTSDSTVNRLYENICWSMRANFFSIPTDCPQRNERMGWSGDLSMFARTAGYLTDTDRFLARHLQALRDLQDNNGRFGDIAPIGNGFGGILWGSVGITVPWELYCQYGDRSILIEHYEAMKRYADYLETCVGADGTISEHTILELGDWLGPENSRNDVGFLLSTYELYDLDIMTKVASVMNRGEDIEKYRSLYEVRKKWFNHKYVDQKTHRTLDVNGKKMDTQTSYAVPLALGAFDEAERSYAVRYLAEACQRQNLDDKKVKRPAYSLMTGFIGTAWISKALSDGGYTDIAYKMLENHAYPSWLYPVDQGATTIWERLDSYTKDNGFGGNSSMNSFNHYSFGAVGAWLYNYSLGIQRDDMSPGWQHFILQPQPDFGGKLTWAKGYYDSPYGRIESAWKRQQNSWVYDAVVPDNTTATLHIPVSEGQSTVSISKNGIKQQLPVEQHCSSLELQPGRYHFVVSK